MTAARRAFDAYIAARNTHRFDKVLPLIAPAATYWFGPARHETPADIQAALERAGGGGTNVSICAGCTGLVFPEDLAPQVTSG